MAELTDRATRALIAVTSALPRDGRARKVALATIAARIDRDPSRITRYIDALEEFQQASGYEFVSIRRGNKVTKGEFADQWQRHVYAAFQRSVTEDRWSDDWRGGGDSPASLCREQIAAEALARIPRIKKDDTGNDDTDMSDEDRRKQAEAAVQTARRKAAQIEPRLVRIFADLEELAAIDPFVARVAFDHATRKLREVATKTDRRIQDAAFRFMRSEDRDDEDAAWREADSGYTCDDFDHPEPGEGQKISPLPSMGRLAHAQVRFPATLTEERDLAENGLTRNFEPISEPKTTIETALNHAEKGRRILPVFGLRPTGGCECPRGLECPSNGKHPRISGWPREATSDPATIGKWFTRWPRSNVGLAMGEGLLTLDFDGAEGEALHAELTECGLIEPTLSQRTGSGGLHLIYSNAPDLPNAVKPTPGLDLRSAGGFVVIAPSINAKGCYEWRDGPSDPQPLPQGLLEFIQGSLIERERARMVEPSRQARTFEGSSNGSLPSVIGEGSRNRTLFAYACGRRNSGADAHQLLTVLLEVNACRCTPPLPEAEVRAIVASVCRYQPSAAYV